MLNICRDAFFGVGTGFDITRVRTTASDQGIAGPIQTKIVRIEMKNKNMNVIEKMKGGV